MDMILMQIEPTTELPKIDTGELATQALLPISLTLSVYHIAETQIVWDSILVSVKYTKACFLTKHIAQTWLRSLGIVP